jgi:hypothetical protein
MCSGKFTGWWQLPLIAPRGELVFRRVKGTWVMTESKGDGQVLRSARGSVLLSAAVALGCIGCGAESLDGEPIEQVSEALNIGNINDLRNMSQNLSGNYVLTRNITMGSSDPVFVPIGSPFNPFRGTFDGRGFTITNLRIQTNGGFYTGLFSATDGAYLNRVRLNNVNVSGGSFTGAIVGTMTNTTITRSWVTGAVSCPTSSPSSWAVGMAVGYAGDYSRVDQSYATGTITGRASTIGGFFGEIVSFGTFDANNEGPPAKIAEVFTNVNVNPTIPSGSSEVVAGGLVGYVQGAWIEDINSVGPVRGRGAVGGVVGRAKNDDPNSIPNLINDVISRGNVTASGSSPAGPIGSWIGFAPRCLAWYDLSTDSGTPAPTDDIWCNLGWGSLDLKGPYQDVADPSDWTTRNIGIFYKGEWISQDLVDNGNYPQCQVGSGSDGDWGFGTCGDSDPQAWSLNTEGEYNTLVRIPNPSVQPK